MSWLNLSGDSTVALTSIEITVWNISLPDQWSSVLTSQFLDSVVPYIDSETDSTMWSWDQSFDMNSIDCTCYVEISLLQQTDLISFGLVVYVGDDHHRPILKHLSDELSYQSSQIFNTQVINLAFDYLLPPSQYGLLETEISLLAEVRICPAPNAICVGGYTTIPSNNLSIGDELELQIDTHSNSIPEGYYLLQVQIQDVYLTLSNNITQYVVFDQTVPNVSLTAVDQVNESQSIVVDIDVDDGYIGSNFVITWSITEPDGTPRAVSNSELLDDNRLEFKPTKSGEYRVNALVRDLGGHLVVVNHNVTVFNIAPVAKVRYDGFLIKDGSTITVPASGDWVFSANTSTDSPNDQDLLDFYWFVDGKTLLSGKSYLSSSDIQNSNYREIRIQVVDDDGEIAELSFEVVQQEAEKTASSSNSLLASIVSILFIFFISLFVFLRQRSQSDSNTGFVKWTERGEEPKK
ncbi:MAG: hypothetical protein ACPH9F_01845 [Candidatus Poseidoniaceae archaeon]